MINRSQRSTAKVHNSSLPTAAIAHLHVFQTANTFHATVQAGSMGALLTAITIPNWPLPPFLLPVIRKHMINPGKCLFP